MVYTTNVQAIGFTHNSNDMAFSQYCNSEMSVTKLCCPNSKLQLELVYMTSEENHNHTDDLSIK